MRCGPLLLLAVMICGLPSAGLCRESPPFSRYRAIADRGMFRPLWRSSQKTPAELAAERKALERHRQQEAEQKLARLRQEEEIRTLETKKKQIQNTLTLTGIVDDGSQLIAFIRHGGQGNKTVMVKQDDVVEESRVISIDKESSEVLLDYRNMFTVRLTLKK